MGAGGDTIKEAQQSCELSLTREGGWRSVLAKTGLKLEIPANSGFVLERSVNP